MRLCSTCQTEAEFSKTQFKLGDAGVCISCTRGRNVKDSQTQKRCQKCKKIFAQQGHFTDYQWENFAKPICIECTKGPNVKPPKTTAKCQTCKRTLAREGHFTEYQ